MPTRPEDILPDLMQRAAAERNRRAGALRRRLNNAIDEAGRSLQSRDTKRMAEAVNTLNQAIRAEAV